VPAEPLPLIPAEPVLPAPVEPLPVAPAEVPLLPVAPAEAPLLPLAEVPVPAALLFAADFSFGCPVARSMQWVAEETLDGVAPGEVEDEGDDDD